MAAAPSESNDQLAAAPSTSTDPSCIWFVHTGNANQLLPPELLHLTLSLAKPTPSIPAVCSMFHSICSNGHDVYISWRNFVLLGDGWVIQDPNTLVMLSDLPEHLKSLIVGSSARTYSKATGFAPSQPARSDPVVTVKLLRQLYKSTLLRYSLKRGEIPEDERVDVDPESHMLAALDALFAPHLKNYHWWRPMTDALILPVYLLRASQLDQLDECLQYLLGSPMGRELTLATMTWASWQAICLDDRSETKHLFEGLAETQGKHRRAQYPIVLATLALLEWSLPMLHVVMRHFPSALTTLDIATFATSGYPRVFSSMLSLLGSSPSLPDSVDRIMDMHEWLEVHSGQRLVSPLASLCRPRTPLQYLEQVLIDIDIPRLRMAEQEHNEALSTAERKGIAECIGTVGSVELLSLVLNHGFALGLVEWVLLVTCDVQKWWVVLQQHVESKDEQCNVAFSGLWHAGHDFWQVITLFRALNGTPTLPDPTTSLARILTHLETSFPLHSPMLSRELCCLATIFFFIVHARNPSLPVHELDCIRALGLPQLASLVTAVFMTLAIFDEALADLIDFGPQWPVAEALAAYALGVLEGSHEDEPPFFDYLHINLQETLVAMISKLALIPFEDDVEDEYSYSHDPQVVCRILGRFAQLDLQFVAMAAVYDEWEPDAVQGVFELIPVAEQECAKLCRSIVFAAISTSEVEVDSIVKKHQAHAARVPRDWVESMVAWERACVYIERLYMR